MTCASDTQGSTILDGLAHNRTLEILNLERNELGSKTAKKIAAIIAKNGKLTKLNLRLNMISDEDAKSIIESLNKNKKLILLNLEYNKIKAEIQNILEDISKSKKGLEIKI